MNPSEFRGVPLKKLLFPLTLVLFLLLSACGAPASGAGEGTLTIAATTYPVYLFTTAVTEGIEGVEVVQLVNQPTSCLHDYTLTVNDMKAIEKADVLVMNGAGLEDFMSDALARSDAVSVDCSAGIALLPTLEHEGHDGHDHEEEYDPHIWMDPDNALQMMQNISAGLAPLLPEQAQIMADNVTRAGLRFQSEISAPSGAPRGQELITFHDGFQYFARAFGLTMLKAIEEEEGAETSAAEIKEIVALVGGHGIPAIFTEKNGSDATAKAIARETGVSVFQLDMIMSGAGDGIGPYIDAVNANIDTITEAFQ